jgi:hypothetical protein
MQLTLDVVSFDKDYQGRVGFSPCIVCIRAQSECIPKPSIVAIPEGVVPAQTQVVTQDEAGIRRQDSDGLGGVWTR